MVIEPGEVGVEAPAFTIVINDDVLTGGESFSVKMLDGHAVIGWRMTGVNGGLGVGHGLMIFLRCGGHTREKEAGVAVMDLCARLVVRRAAMSFGSAEQGIGVFEHVWKVGDCEGVWL